MVFLFLFLKLENVLAVPVICSSIILDETSKNELVLQLSVSVITRDFKDITFLFFVIQIDLARA